MYKNLKINKNKKESTVDIEAEVPQDVLAEYRQTAVKEIQKDFESPGFRKGNVPEDVVVKEVGEPKILQQAAEAALQDVAPQILKDEDMWALGSPQVAITKIAPGNDLGFKMRVAVPPEVKLPNYKKIAKTVLEEAGEPEVEEIKDEEVDAVINQLRAMRSQGEEGEMPELNDEFAKQLGFSDVKTLREQIRENVAQEKDMEQRKKVREQMIKRIVEEAGVEIPEMVVNQEVGLIRNRFYQELSQADMTMEDYLEKSGMTEEELDESHRNHVRDQLGAKFVVEQIAEKEGIEPDETEMEHQKQIMKQRHPEASDDQINQHLQAAMTHEQVFQFLEDLGEQSEY